MQVARVKYELPPVFLILMTIHGARRDQPERAAEGGMIGDWKPIETAPKDDNAILVCNAKYQDGFMQVVYFKPADSCPEWLWATSDGPTFHENTFTHWMPLPEPPHA